jgi:hypothetical protein
MSFAAYLGSLFDSILIGMVCLGLGFEAFASLKRADKGRKRD